MAKVGAALLVLGGGAIVGYILYLVFRLLYTEPDVPLVFQVATPVALVGLILMVVAVARDRLRASRRERFEEVEH